MAYEDYPENMDDVRSDYIMGRTQWSLVSDGEAGMEFEDFMTEHDREVKAQAFEAAAVRVRANFAEHGEQCPWVGFLDDEAARIRKGH